MRASGPPPRLEDFDDEFEFACPETGEGQELFEAFMRERLAGYEGNEILWFTDQLVPIR